MSAALCAARKSECVCSLAFTHNGHHVCECEGSWDIDGNVVAWPSLVVEEGGPFPVGSRPWDGADASAEGLRALLGGALERDAGLAMDLAHDESDGGLGVIELP